jgi:hypothetical protein
VLGKTCYTPRAAPTEPTDRTEGSTVMCKFPEAFCQKEKREVNHQVLRWMTVALRGWRGPDLGLSHCWLAIIDIGGDHRLFDFGRSKIGTSSYTFKKNCGFTLALLQYCHKSNRIATIPDHNPLSLFVAAWKRLPLRNANLRGPHIVVGIS